MLIRRENIIIIVYAGLKNVISAIEPSSETEAKLATRRTDLISELTKPATETAFDSTESKLVPERTCEILEATDSKVMTD